MKCLSSKVRAIRKHMDKELKNKNNARLQLGQALSSVMINVDSPETRGHVQKALDYLNGKVTDE